MAEARRVTVSLLGELDRQILELRKEDRFIRCSYSESVRQILEHGLSALSKERRHHVHCGVG